MKPLFAVYVILFCHVLSCSKDTAKAKPLHNKKVLVLGNSITQNGTYVDFLEYALRKRFTKDRLDIVSIGLSGETASGDSEKDHAFPRPYIHNRLQSALNLVKPDLVLASYGMNDGIYSNFSAIRFDNYKKGILRLKETVEATGSEIIFLSPTPFDASSKTTYNGLEHYSYKRPYVNYNEVLKAYTAWLKTIEHVKVIDLNTYLNEKLITLKSKFKDSTFIPDGVHPNTIGHYYMTEKILNDLYPGTTLGNTIEDIEKFERDSLFKATRKRRKIRSKGWLAYVGYVSKDTVKSNTITPTIEQVRQLDLVISSLLQK